MPDIQTKRTLANPLTLWGGLVCYPRIIEWLIAENLLFFSVFALDKRHNIIECRLLSEVETSEESKKTDISLALNMTFIS